MRSAKKRILLVEDDPDHRGGLAEALGGRFEVTEAACAEEALGLLDLQPYDLLVTDYRLRGATGTWLARMAIRHGHLAPSQILLITAYDRLHDSQGLEVLHKPFSFDRLLGRIDGTLTAPSVPCPTAEPCHRICLVLYVNDSFPSVRASRTLRSILARYRADQVALMTVDISRRPDHHAEEDRVVATPTLVRTFPAPRVWITGDLRKHQAVERLLDETGVELAEMPQARIAGQSS